jgi:hypothetical protein
MTETLSSVPSKPHTHRDSFFSPGDRNNSHLGFLQHLRPPPPGYSGRRSPAVRRRRQVEPQLTPHPFHGRRASPRPSCAPPRRRPDRAKRPALPWSISSSHYCGRRPALLPWIQRLHAPPPSRSRRVYYMDVRITTRTCRACASPS